MLCGISVRFQTLSPSERQVPHALLTRPPLNLSDSIRKLHLLSFVRLACVRHAASVRPEPGSNSLKYFIKTLTRSNRISELSYSSFRNTCVFLCFCPFFTSFSSRSVPIPLGIFPGPLVSFRCLIFKVLRRSFLASQLYYNTKPTSFCQPLFSPFFTFF
jgi:hypothetical protein